jgi:hypothetical protein
MIAAAFFIALPDEIADMASQCLPLLFRPKGEICLCCSGVKRNACVRKIPPAGRNDNLAVAA